MLFEVIQTTKWSNILQPGCLLLAKQQFNAPESLLQCSYDPAPGDRCYTVTPPVQAEGPLKQITTSKHNTGTSAPPSTGAAKLLETNHLKLFKTFGLN